MLYIMQNNGLLSKADKHFAEFALLGYTLHHILTHKNYKRGNRTLWLIITIVLMNFVGPIMYFLLGKEDA